MSRKFTMKKITPKNNETVQIILGVLLIASIVTLGPMFSKWYGRNERTIINKNGKVIQGVVIGIGRYAKIEYEFKNKKYQIRYYNPPESIAENDQIDIMVDTIAPEDAFVASQLGE